MMAEHKDTVFIVIGLGTSEEHATDEDVEALRKFIDERTHFGPLGVISHAVTDPALCRRIRAHLAFRLMQEGGDDDAVRGLRDEAP